MTWIPPVDWDVGEVLTAADLNKINANLNALKTPPSGFAKGVAGGTNVAASTAATTGFDPIVIDSSWILALTTTGGDIMIGFTGSILVPTGQNVTFDFDVDGVRVGAYNTGGGLAYVQNNFSTFNMITSVAPVTLARGVNAGEHVIKLVWKASATTVQLYNNVTCIPTFWAREV